MATYKEIQGYKIPAISADPPAPAEGEIWYNTTSEGLKYAGPAAWATITSSPLQKQTQYTAGSSTAIMIAGGSPPTNATSDWNGSSWSTGGVMTVSIYNGGSCGTQTAALAFGGYISGPGHSAIAQTYNGSSWSAVNSMPGTIESNGGAGTSTTAMSTGGSAPGGLVNTNSTQWTGTCWNAGPSLTGAVSSTGAHGDSSTSAVVSGGTPGQSPPSQRGVQKFNGTSWSNLASLLVGGRGRTAGIGGTNAGIIACGSTTDPAGASIQSTTEAWDGTSWSSLATFVGTPVTNCGGSTTASNTTHMTVGGISADPGGTTQGTASVYADPGIKTVTAT